MKLENLTAKKEILTFCDDRISQLKKERQKILSQCEDEFEYEINTSFDAKIDEIKHIKNSLVNDELRDHSKNHAHGIQ